MGQIFQSYSGNGKFVWVDTTGTEPLLLLTNRAVKVFVSSQTCETTGHSVTQTVYN